MNAPFTPDDDDLELPFAPEGWCVDSEEKAAWAAERILEGREAILRLERQFERNLTRAHRELARRESFLGAQLKAWAQANPPRRGKTIHLATADLSFRRTAGGIVIENEEQALEWAEQHCPEAIRRGVLRKLDFALMKRRAAQLMSEKTIEAARGHSLLPAAPSIEESFARADAALQAGRAALPPGTAFDEGEEQFHVVEPKDPK